MHSTQGEHCRQTVGSTCIAVTLTNIFFKAFANYGISLNKWPGNWYWYMINQDICVFNFGHVGDQKKVHNEWPWKPKADKQGSQDPDVCFTMSTKYIFNLQSQAVTKAVKLLFASLPANYCNLDSTKY